MRACYPHTAGFAVNPRDGVRVFYEVFGPPDAARTILFLPTWTLVDSRVWKGQVPYFARHGFRVIAFDNRGNGQSDRPATGYSVDDIAHDALAVLDATGVQQAALVSLSAGGRWALKLAAEHAERITRMILIAPSVALGGAPPRRTRFSEPRETYEGFDKYSEPYWRANYPEFLDFWARECQSELHSTKQIED